MFHYEIDITIPVNSNAKTPGGKDALSRKLNQDESLKRRIEVALSAWADEKFKPVGYERCGAVEETRLNNTKPIMVREIRKVE